MPQLSSATAAGPFLRSSLWGTLEVDGDAVLDPELSVASPAWRPMEALREEQARLDYARNSAALAEADRLPAPERLARWLYLASGGGLDGSASREAVERLLRLPDAEAALLPGLLSPDRFDELVLLRVIVPAYGRRAAPAVLREAGAAEGLRRALLLALLRLLPAAEGFKPAAVALRDRDWRVRREAAGALGTWFDRELGEEPGRVPFLEESAAMCERAEPQAPLAEEALRRFGWKRLPDLLAALALDPASNGGERVELLRRSPNPFDPVPPETLQAYARLACARPKAFAAAARRELQDLRKLEGQARQRLVLVAEEEDPDLLPLALAGLGQLGRPQDAERVAAGLAAGSAAVREAAAAGLARMGAAGERGVRWALASSSAPTRALGAAAAGQSSEPGVVRLLVGALRDPDEDVRQTAIAALSSVQAPNAPVRKELVAELERLAAADPSASVRAAAAYAAAAFR